MRPLVITLLHIGPKLSVPSVHPPVITNHSLEIIKGTSSHFMGVGSGSLSFFLSFSCSFFSCLKSEHLHVTSLSIRCYFLHAQSKPGHACRVRQRISGFSSNLPLLSTRWRATVASLSSQQNLVSTTRSSSGIFFHLPFAYTIYYPSILSWALQRSTNALGTP